jgi:hypothetical protein
MSPGAKNQRKKVSRRDCMQARAQLEAGGLSHHDERRLRTIVHTWELESGRRHLEFRHLMIAVVSGVAAMVVIGAALGLLPAIEAARGDGAIGTFVVSGENCARRSGCVWMGTFSGQSEVVPNVAYQGNLEASTQPGARIPARYPGFGQVYALHSSHTWAWDLVIMLFLGSVIGFLVWLTPVGMRQRAGKDASAYGPGVQL